MLDEYIRKAIAEEEENLKALEIEYQDNCLDYFTEKGIINGKLFTEDIEPSVFLPGVTSSREALISAKTKIERLRSAQIAQARLKGGVI